METPATELQADPSAIISFRAAELGDMPQIDQLLRPFVVAKKLLRRTKAEMAVLVTNAFVAESESRIVGFAAVEIYSRKLAEVQSLAVDENFQRHGIGSQLVLMCVERAREKGVLEVMAISSSERFLTQLGFDYSLPDQKRALFYQLRTREEMYSQNDEEDE